MQVFNLVVGLDMLRAGGVAGIDPAGFDAGVDAALNIGGEAVTYHQAFALVETGDPGEGGFKILFGGLVVADLLGYKGNLSVRNFILKRSFVATVRWKLNI